MTRRNFVPALLQAYTGFRLDPTNIEFLAPDLKVPETTNAPAKAGHRVRIGSADLYHVLFLPEDWRAGGRYPLIVEYPGSGPGFLTPNFRETTVRSGKPDDTVLGYGLSEGRGYLWLSLPVVTADKQVTATGWWGDPQTTVDYCRASVLSTCRRFGGDLNRILLCGFSRGSIACNFIGLHDDSVAGLWRAFFCHSHYDGVFRWPYPGSDKQSALTRLQRLKGRPQFISHEVGGNENGVIPSSRHRPKYVGSVAETRRYLESTKIVGDFTFGTLPYPYHTDAWILRTTVLRETVRQWMRKVLA